MSPEGVACIAKNKHRVGMQLRSKTPPPKPPRSVWIIAVKKMPLAAVGRVIK